MCDTTEKLNRRRFLQTATAGGAGVAAAGGLAAVGGLAAAGGLAAPALAKNAAKISWRITSSFPASLETIASTLEVFVKAVADATDGKFTIKFEPAKENASPFTIAEAVTKGRIEMAQTASHVLASKDPTFAFGSGVPFGLNARQMNAWMFEGGGQELLGDFYAKHNIHAIPVGNTGCQMGGWWRDEIKSLADLKGKKIVVGGFASQIVKKLGAEPVAMPGHKIFEALKSGKIDAAEWVGPHDDEKLGLYKGAKNYYYPGWWQPGMMIHVFINRAKWETLPKNYQAIVMAAGQTANAVMMARYDAKNPAALKRLLRKGVQLQPFPAEIMNAAFAAADKTYGEIAAANPAFAKVYDSWKAFRADQYLWSQVAELGIDAFQAGALNRR